MRRFAFPEDLLPGSLTESGTRCGKPACPCAPPDDPGHSGWTLPFRNPDRRRVERIPTAGAEQVRERVRAGRQFQDAVRDVLTTNAELLVRARKQKLDPPGAQPTCARFSSAKALGLQHDYLPELPAKIAPNQDPPPRNSPCRPAHPRRRLWSVHSETAASATSATPAP